MTYAGAGGDTGRQMLLPKEIDGLNRLEGSLTTQSLDNWLAKSRPQNVKVFLPKFKLTAQFSLAETFAAMGIRDAFSPAADFSGMDGERDLFISAVAHKAFIDVNEEGTEAAAATGTVMNMLAVMPRPTPVFRADHPFVFLIRDRVSGSILFLGRVLDPTSS
jgi:serpin B